MESRMQSHPSRNPYAHFVLDRTSLPKDPDPFNTEVHTHLAHGVVGYLGLTSPEQLEPYGIHSAVDLVDLVSRVSVAYHGQ